MKKLLLSLATLLCGVTAWAEVLPTQELKASSNLPTGTPEYQFYVRQTKSDGQYWKPSTAPTNDKGQAGKFAFYAVPGLTNCYYIYNVDEQKWVNYTVTSANMQDFASLADNFNANAYWEITGSTMTGSTASCYQMKPTKNTIGNSDIKSDSYANWYTGAAADHTLGLWQEAPTTDAGSAWSLEAVDADNSILMAQEIAFAKSILEAEGYSYTKGSNIITTDNVTTILSSPYTETREGSIENLVDGNAATFWHSKWSNDAGQGESKLNGSHYLVADISSTITESNPVPERLSFTYTRRSNANADKTTRLAVYGVPTDGTVAEDSRDGLTILAVVSMPESSNPCENTFQTKGFTKFRFYSEVTTSNRGYFHIGDFQLNPMTEADDNAENLKTLAAALATAETKTSPTQEDIDALKAENAKFMADETARAEAQALLDLTGVGYPSATAEARVNLVNALANPAGVQTHVLEALMAAYKASAEIALPEDGKAYTFTFVAINGTEYKMTANGTTLSASNDADATAATFYCHKYTNVDGNERFAFVTPDGKFLAYNTLKDYYTTHVNADKRLQTDCSISSMVGSSSEQITASLKEQLFGTIFITVDNRTLESLDNNGVFIWSGTGFDKTTAPFFKSDRANLTSAIKVTEVADYAANDAVLRAASTIDPLVAGYTWAPGETKTIGSGIGEYSYQLYGTSYTAFNDFETAVNAVTEAIGASDYAIGINMPAPGFYRIKSMNANETARNGKYVQVVADADGMTLQNETEDAHDIKSVLYIDANRNILSYASGRYWNDYGSQATIGAEGTAWTISENSDVAGAYALKASGKTADNDFLSDWTGSAPTNGRNDGNAAWTFEAVTWLPVPVSVQAGYATLYSPVALGNSYDGVKRVEVYTATLNEDKGSVELTECAEGVPANTGVILKYLTGINETDQCVYLPVSNTEINASASDLDGVLAAKYFDEQGYILAKPADDNIGLYKTRMTDKQWLLKGFKAYLPGSLVTSTEGAARFFFDFGTTTGIEDINGAETEENTIIYDLSGRRVQNAQKGIYIINGKKVIK